MRQGCWCAGPASGESEGKRVTTSEVLLAAADSAAAGVRYLSLAITRLESATSRGNAGKICKGLHA